MAKHQHSEPGLAGSDADGERGDSSRLGESAPGSRGVSGLEPSARQRTQVPDEYRRFSPKLCMMLFEDHPSGLRTLGE